MVAGGGVGAGGTSAASRSPDRDSSVLRRQRTTISPFRNTHEIAYKIYRAKGNYALAMQHLEAFKEVFVHVVRLAGAAGLVKLGNVATDGTKIQGNASRHKAMSYGYMKQEVERLREAIEVLVTRAYQQDEAEEAALGSRRGDELPAELARREERLARMETAMRRLEAAVPDACLPSISADMRRRGRNCRN